MGEQIVTRRELFAALPWPMVPFSGTCRPWSLLLPPPHGPSVGGESWRDEPTTALEIRSGPR